MPAPAPKVKKWYRVNLMGGPLSKDEGEAESSPSLLSGREKVDFVQAGIVAIHGVVKEGIEAWQDAGRDPKNPPFITVFAGGSEKGTLLAKEHAQMTYEVWYDATVTEATVHSHLKKVIQPILDGIISGVEGAHWPLTAKKVDKKGNVRTKVGGWFYQLAYTHKEIDMDWGFVRRVSVDTAGAAALDVFCVDDIWSEVVALFTKTAVGQTGDSGKKAYKILAAIVQGRTHAAMEIITKTNWVMTLLKFNEVHGIQYLQLDPITNSMIMLSTGAYGFGTDWVSSQYGNCLDQGRSSSFMHIARNGLLGQCRSLLTQIWYGQANDMASMRNMSTTRPAYLPSLEICARMSLDELKNLEKNNMQIPKRLHLIPDCMFDLNKPVGIVVDIAAGLEDRYVDDSESSFMFGSVMKELAVNVNPQILPAFYRGGDSKGAYVAQHLHTILKIANARGLPTVSEPDIYSTFTSGTPKLANIACAGQEFNTTEERIQFILDAYLKRDPIEELNYDIKYNTSLETFKNELVLNSWSKKSGLHLHVIGIDHWMKNVGLGGDELVTTAAIEALAQQGGKGCKPLRKKTPESPTDLFDEPLRGNHTPAIPRAGPPEVGGLPMPKSLANDAGTHIKEKHYFIVGYWVGHAEHKYIGGVDSHGDGGTESMWTAIKQAASVDAAAEILLSHSPNEFYTRGPSILKQKTLQLAMERRKTMDTFRGLDKFNHAKLPLYRKTVSGRQKLKSVLLCGESNTGKTCFAAAHGKRPYIVKTIDALQLIPSDCDLLVFDDMRFDEGDSAVTPETMICLLDCAFEGQIKCRNQDGNIPPIARIFTSNLRRAPFPEGANEEQSIAIRRRFRWPKYVCKGDLFSATPDDDSEVQRRDRAGRVRPGRCVHIGSGPMSFCTWCISFVCMCVYRCGYWVAQVQVS